MPLIFKKVYGDVDGKRQVIRTEKISGDAAREYIAKRDAERAKSKEQRTMKNLFAKLFAKKMEPVVEEKMQSASKKLNLKYDSKKKELTLPGGFLDFRPEKNTEQQRRDLTFQNQQRITQRNIARLQEDRRKASGARADLAERGLLQNVNLGPRIDSTLNIFKPGGLFDFRLF